jgi:hypothetical protein
LIEVELAYYVFPAGRVLTTGDFRGANLELPPGRWEMTVPLSGAIAFVRALGIRLPRARRLDRCDSEGVPVYLEASTERSAAFHERLGFIHLGELRVPNGPRCWPMRRPPVAA